MSARCVIATACALLLSGAAQAASFVVRNTDGPGVGFNDPSPFAAAAGNSAQTLGAARLNVFNRAAQLWAAKLQSAIPVVINASFAPLGQCTPSSGTLGMAGSSVEVRDFPGAPMANTFFPSALANALAGRDLVPGESDISTRFNGSVDSDPNCLGGRGFYYGLDDGAPSNQPDLLNTVMHEIGHGLGFSSDVDPQTGDSIESGNPQAVGIYDYFVYDEAQRTTWNRLTGAQRQASAVNSGHLAWSGPAVTQAAAGLSGGRTANGFLRLYAPSLVDGGSSISHWDTLVTPDLLMEPFLNAGLHASDGVDLTICAFRDIGWTLTAGVQCPDTGTEPNTAASATAPAEPAAPMPSPTATPAPAAPTPSPATTPTPAAPTPSPTAAPAKPAVATPDSGAAAQTNTGGGGAMPQVLLALFGFLALWRREKTI